MVFLTALWLPILLSAVIVFVASSIIHMVLPYHKSDYSKLPDEDKLLDALRGAGLAPGRLYHFPHCADHKQMGSPEMQEKYKKGPVGLLTILPSGAPAMGSFLAKWFTYCVVISLVAAYLTGRTLATGAPYLTVFRVAGTAAFLGYAGAHASDSIWKGQSWSTTFKHIFDGLIYGMLTGGTFGWLWPR
jgi:hypothetical protein